MAKSTKPAQQGKQAKPQKKSIARNRSARHEYFIDETFEAGIELTGTEVKSLRERASQITDAFCLIRGGQCWLHGVHIHPYSNRRDVDREIARALKSRSR